MSGGATHAVQYANLLLLVGSFEVVAGAVRARVDCAPIEVDLLTAPRDLLKQGLVTRQLVTRLEQALDEGHQQPNVGELDRWV